VEGPTRNTAPRHPIKFEKDQASHRIPTSGIELSKKLRLSANGNRDQTVIIIEKPPGQEALAFPPIAGV